MTISIITATLNNRDIIEDCIKSVINQTYKDIEYIIVDGGSRDGTLDIIQKYKDRISIIHQKSKGLYSALNEGLGHASGEVIGFLNADDLYVSDRAIEKVAVVFEKYNVESCYADLQYVKRNNINRTIRYWKSSVFDYNNLKLGWMPPHPTFFVRKDVYQKLGFFNTDFKISSDYEMVLRLLYKYKISTYYLPQMLLKMRIGGLSNKNIINIIRKSFEDYKVCRLYHLGLFTLFSKNINKISQFILLNREGR